MTTSPPPQSTLPALPEAELLICVTCRVLARPASTDHPAGVDKPEGTGNAEDETRPGAQLYAALVAKPLPAGLRVRAVECLSNCTRGCTVALRGGAERWSYVYGNLDPAEHAEIVLDGAQRYQAAADGLVPWRERSQHFRKNCIARLPPLTLPPTDPIPVDPA